MKYLSQLLSLTIYVLVGCQPAEVASPGELHTKSAVSEVNLEPGQHEKRTMNSGTKEEIQAVLLHPVMWNIYGCTEHGGRGLLGDAYGKDCFALEHDPDRASDRYFLSQYKNDGMNNEDWFGWEAPLLAPCDGIVESMMENGEPNEPGQKLSREELKPAAQVVFTCDTGENVVYAHIRNANVYIEVGDRVKAGAIVAEVGNNGVSRSPHVHIGAWREETPLQIRFDLRLLN